MWIRVLGKWVDEMKVKMDVPWALWYAYADIAMNPDMKVKPWKFVAQLREADEQEMESLFLYGQEHLGLL